MSLVERTPSIDEAVKTKSCSSDLQEAADLYLKSDFISNGEEEEVVIKPGSLEGAKRIHEEVLTILMDSLTTATNQLMQAVSIQVLNDISIHMLCYYQ